MTASHRRHDLSDRVWERLWPHLPGEAGKVGRPAQSLPRAATRGQSPVSGRSVLDFAHGGAPVSSTGQAVAGPAPGLRGLEEHPSAVLPLAGPRRLGPTSGDGD